MQQNSFFHTQVSTQFCLDAKLLCSSLQASLDIKFDTSCTWMSLERHCSTTRPNRIYTHLVWIMLVSCDAASVL